MEFVLSKEAQTFLKNNQGLRVVFTNGCFDIIHAGHVTYLEEARKLGDLLFLGLNSDASIKRLKGNSRPIVGEKDRKKVLEAIRFVDFVEIFEEDTPLELIKQVQPDVLVKGGDWDISKIVGASEVSSYGGVVKSISFVEGRSTTNIVDKIKNNAESK